MSRKVDKLLISVSIALVVIVVGALYLQPEQSQVVASLIFGKLTTWFGSVVLLLWGSD